MIQLTQRAIDLILEFEGFDDGGWPGGASGVTIGHGYDLGYHSAEQFSRDWRQRLTPEDFRKLRACLGYRGQAAQKLAKTIKGTLHSLDRADADDVLRLTSLPNAARLVEMVFPGVGTLPPDAQGALVSLVFNRGGRLKDADPAAEERREMRSIAKLVELYTLAAAKSDRVLCASYLRGIADQIRSMKRLWAGKSLDGLLRRRDAEADLVESTSTTLKI